MSFPVIAYNNVYETGTISATTTDSGSDYDVTNIKDWRPYELWKASGTSTVYLVVNAGSPVLANTLLIMNHNLFTIGATISVDRSTNGTSWVNVLSGFTPANNKTIYKEFTDSTYQYFRIGFTGMSAAPYTGISFVGPRLTFTQPLTAGEVWDPNGYIIKSRSQISPVGNILGNVVDRKEILLAPHFDHLDSSFVNGNFNTFWETHGSLQTPFFWLWEPTNHTEDVHLVVIPNDMPKLFPYRKTTNYRDVTLQLRGVIEV